MRIFTETGSRLVGIGGTNHSGKDTAGDHLSAAHGFLHVSMSDVLRGVARQLGVDTNRESLIEIGVRLRERDGPGAVVSRGIEQWQEQQGRYPGGLVLSSIRVVGEAEEVNRQGGTLLFVDAPAELRYAHSAERLRGDETFTTPEEYVAQEQTELLGLGGPNRPHLRAVQSMAAVTIINDGSMEYYVQALDGALSLSGH